MISCENVSDGNVRYPVCAGYAWKIDRRQWRPVSLGPGPRSVSPQVYDSLRGSDAHITKSPAMSPGSAYPRLSGWITRSLGGMPLREQAETKKTIMLS